MSSSVTLRESTLAKAIESAKNYEPSHRSNIPLSEAASRKRAHSHESHKIEVDFEFDKAQRSLFQVYIIFKASEILKFRTWHAKTTLQCGHSQCGCCHSCHCALVPNFKDNVMQTIAQEIASDKKLSPRKRLILGHRGLSSPEKEKLVDLNEEEVETSLRKTLGVSFNHTFSGTLFEKQLNSTIECPIDSNYFDKHKERHLRDIFHTYVGKIYIKEFQDAEQAFEEFYEEVSAFFLRSTKNLMEKEKQLLDLQEVEKNLQDFEEPFLKKECSQPADIADDKFIAYLENIGRFFEIKDKLKEKLPHAPHYDIKEVSRRKDIYWLDVFNKEYLAFKNKEIECEDIKQCFLRNRRALQKIPITKEEPDLPALISIRLQKEAAFAQYDGVLALKCHIKDFPKYFFGIKDEEGWRIPTLEEITQFALTMTKKESIKKRKL